MASQDTTESSTERDTVETSTPVTASTSTTEAPVVIVKQVNEINEDGSYTVGYEASDGSFRLETKDAEGNVEGNDISDILLDILGDEYLLSIPTLID